jgi:ribonuclease HI
MRRFPTTLARRKPTPLDRRPRDRLTTNTTSGHLCCLATTQQYPRPREENTRVRDRSGGLQGRRRQRREGRATKDAQRRALAKAHAKPDRAVVPPRPGFAILWADGGARGTPGPAAIGYVIDDHAGVRVAEHAEMIGTTTAAEAEYRALLAGLARAHELGLTEVTARSDSKPLIAHVNGDGHIRNARLVG